VHEIVVFGPCSVDILDALRDLTLAGEPMQLGLVVAIALPIGGLGLPFLVDFLLHAWHYHRAARKDALHADEVMSPQCPMRGARWMCLP